MNRHLNDNELASAVAGFTLDPEARTHLDGCISCRRSITRFLDQVDERRMAMERETPDWDQQLQQVLVNLPDQPAAGSRSRRWLGPLLATAASVTIAIGTGLIVQQQTPVSEPSPSPDIKIEEILAQTEALLAEDEIPGFEVFGDVSDEDLAALFGTKNS